MKILVTGATGKVGSGVVDILREKGVQVRVLIRNAAKASQFATDVEVIAGAHDDPAVLDKATKGVDGMFVMSGTIVELARITRAILAAARPNGVRRVVLLSSTSVEADDCDHAGIHKDAENMVIASGLEWTIVRGGQFMSNTLRWADELKAKGELKSYIPSIPTAIIHPRDISAVIVAALTEDGHNGKTYGVTGGELVSPSQCARIISRKIGKDIKFTEMTHDQARQFYIDKFGDTQDMRTKFESLWAENLPWEKVRPDVENVLGRKPLTYDVWVDENVDAFR